MNTFEEYDYSGRFDGGLWRRLLRYAIPYRGHLIGLAALMIFVAVIDALFPMMNRHAIDSFIIPKKTEGPIASCFDNQV